MTKKNENLGIYLAALISVGQSLSSLKIGEWV